MKPLISIVIANYNYGHFLEDAIQSVEVQGVGDQVEIIICDAASTDNSVEIIRKYANGLPPNTLYAEWASSDNARPGVKRSQLITWWCSEKDKGQSDAFNKGFSHARGKYGCWLNADDVLVHGALRLIVAHLSKHPDVEWLAGDSIYLDVGLKVWKCSRGVPLLNFLGRYRPASPVNGPSSIFTLAALGKAGGFDTDAHYVMDVDLWRRFMALKIKLCIVHGYFWGFRLHEQSKTSSSITLHTISDNFSMEADSVNLKYGITKRMRRVSEWINRLERVLTFAYLWSFIDTIRYRNKSLLSIKFNH